MKRLLFTLLASGILMVGAPASALARHHHHRHHRHHARVHHLRFGSDTTTGTTGSSGAGTIASFTNGVLTITLNDGSTVSGKVTDATEIECSSGTNTETGDMRFDGGGSGGGDQGDDNNDQGDDNNDNGANCSSMLVQGTPVQGAELNITSAGAIWGDLELGSGSASGD